MGKILVTGASGFLGHACLDVLKKSDFEIFAVYKSRKGSISSKVKWVEADLHEPKEVDKLLKEIKPEYLLHLAWDMEPGMKLDSHIHFPWVDTSMALIQKFAETNGKRVVISGSCAEYKWGNYLYEEDTTPIQPRNSYGLSKNELHQQVADFCSQGDLSYAWGRVFFTFGPYENKKRLVSHIVHSILKGEKVRTTHGNQVYDYLYVEDVARAMVNLFEKDFSGAVNICSGEPLKLGDLIFKIADQMNGGHLVELGALKANGDTPQYVVGRNQRLKELTGWYPQTNIDSGIQKTIQFIKDKNHLT